MPHPTGHTASAELVTVSRIWDRAPHNAFTDLLRFRGRWFCVFREGRAHVSPDGALRVLASDDGERWQSEALITAPDADLRDAKLTTTPDGRLMLTGAAALHPPSATNHQSMAWFSADGKTWSEGHKIGDPDLWLWRVTWHRGVAYSVGYGTQRDPARRTIRLYTSRDGKVFETRADRIIDKNGMSEHALLFLEDDTCLCLLRHDAPSGGGGAAQLGRARPPYREWTWKDASARIGGPQMIRLPDGRILAAGRFHEERAHTGLRELDPGTGAFTGRLALPSGGDNSYPGMVRHQGLLWVSYYSSHEGKANIYLAKVKV